MRKKTLSQSKKLSDEDEKDEKSEQKSKEEPKKAPHRDTLMMSAQYRYKDNDIDEDKLRKLFNTIKYSV